MNMQLEMYLDLFICCWIVLPSYILLSPDCHINITPYLSQPVLPKCHLGIALSAVDFHLWNTEGVQTQEVF